MRVVGEANAYVCKTEPFRLKADDERERLGTVLHVLAQASPTSTRCCRRSSRTRQRDPSRCSAARVDLVPMPRLETWSTTSTADPHTRSSPATTRRRHGGSRGRSSPGRRSAKPAPVFRKFDPPGATRSPPALRVTLDIVRGHRGSSPAGGTSGRQHPILCRSRSSTTTCTSTSAREGEEALSPARGRARRRRRSESTGSSRSAATWPASGFTVEAVRAVCGAAGVVSRCTPTRCRGSRRAERSTTRLRRGRGGSRPTRGSGSWGRPGSTTTAPARTAIPSQQDAFRWHIDLAKRTRTSPADPRPRRARRRPADPRRGGGAGPHTVLHCFSGDRGWRGVRRARVPTSRSRHRDVQERDRHCATPWP